MEQIISQTSTVTTIKRDHSLYCEATGPIVQEGFVAARVRGFQALQHGSPPIRSHTPLIPCPVPSWYQIYERTTPPKRVTSVKRASSRSTNLSRSLFKSRSNDFGAAAYTTNRRLDTSSWRTNASPAASKSSILCPRAVPSDLIIPRLDFQEEKDGKLYTDDLTDATRRVRSRRSVAERLGSLIDHGWTGQDFLMRASEEQTVFPPNPSPSQDCTKADRVENDAAHSSNDEALNRSRRPAFTPNSTPIQDHNEVDRVKNGVAQFSNHDSSSTSLKQAQPKSYTNRNHTGAEPAGASLSRPEHPDKSRDSAETQRVPTPSPTRNEPDQPPKSDQVFTAQQHPLEGTFLAQRASPPAPQIKQRASTFHLSGDSRPSSDETVGFRTLSLGKMIDRHLSDWQALDAARGSSTQSYESDQSNQVNSLSYQRPERQLAEASSSAATRKSTPTTRRSSWFAKLPQYRMSLDKVPLLKNLSRRTSGNLPESKESFISGDKDIGANPSEQLQLKDLSLPRTEEVQGRKDLEPIFSRTSSLSKLLEHDKKILEEPNVGGSGMVGKQMAMDRYASSRGPQRLSLTDVMMASDSKLTPRSSHSMLAGQASSAEFRTAHGSPEQSPTILNDNAELAMRMSREAPPYTPLLGAQQMTPHSSLQTPVTSPTREEFLSISPSKSISPSSGLMPRRVRSQASLVSASSRSRSERNLRGLNDLEEDDEQHGSQRPFGYADTSVRTVTTKTSLASIPKDQRSTSLGSTSSHYRSERYLQGLNDLQEQDDEQSPQIITKRVGSHSRPISAKPSLASLRANQRAVGSQASSDHESSFRSLSRKPSQARIRTQLHETRPPPAVYEDAEGERMSAAGERMSEEKHPITADAFQWEAPGQGKGIKRVQVIVSLDGADDLLVEATLVKRSRKGA